jgi:hypothetical protein
VVLYGCETWSLTLREEHELRAFENRVLRRMFVPKRDEVPGSWIKLHNQELCDLYSSQSINRIVRFEVFTVVTMKNAVFWVVMPCGSCKNRRFGGTWRLLHQGDKMGELGTTQAATSNRRTLGEIIYSLRVAENIIIRWRNFNIRDIVNQFLCLLFSSA